MKITVASQAAIFGKETSSAGSNFVFLDRKINSIECFVFFKVD